MEAHEIVGLVLAVPVGFLAGAFLLSVAAALCNIENLSYLKCCGICAAQVLLSGGIGWAALSALDQNGYGIADLGKGTPGQLWATILALTGLTLVVMILTVILLRFAIPVGLARAVRMCVLWYAITLLVCGLVGGLVLVGMAGWQIGHPRTNG